MFEAAFPANDELFISMVVRRIGPVDLLHFCLADTENSKKLVHWLLSKTCSWPAEKYVCG
jgi:hypothetical protein